MSLEQVATWAPQAGYEALEVAAWPVGSQHVYQAAHLDVADFTAGDAALVRDLMDRHDLTISAVTYCGNNLHGDAAERDRIHRHLRARIDAAAALGVRYVTTFIGRDIALPVADNLKLAEQLLPPLTRYAADQGVKLLAENCPMEGWHPDGYPANLGYSPSCGTGWPASASASPTTPRHRRGMVGLPRSRPRPARLEHDHRRALLGRVRRGRRRRARGPRVGGALDKTLQGMQVAADTLRPLIVAEPGGRPLPAGP